MPSKILSFLFHMTQAAAQGYSPIPAATRPANQAGSSSESVPPVGHFAAIYENERFVRFKYISTSRR